jgi:hypothetical protein
MAKLPLRDFAMNAVWLEVSLIAQDLIAWTRHSHSTQTLPAATRPGSAAVRPRVSAERPGTRPSIARLRRSSHRSILGVERPPQVVAWAGDQAVQAHLRVPRHATHDPSVLDPIQRPGSG